MVNFVFMVATDAKGEAALCEGGVYSDAPKGEYSGNTIERAHSDVARWNATAKRNGWQARYEVRESMAGVSCDDSNVLSSLEAWQIDALLASERQEAIDATPEGQARIAAQRERFARELQRAAKYVAPSHCDMCGDSLVDGEYPSCDGNAA